MKSLPLVFCALSVFAADPGPPVAGNSNWFPFPISVGDSSQTAIDLSFLNHKPAGSKGFLRAKGEHIVDGDGAPIRLFGTNFCGASCFPGTFEAEKVAAHLAKNGINVVRLHHMDNDWNESLVADTATTKLDEQNLAKLDKLAAELLKNGIYLNINLHVSRTYAGTPKDAPRYSKGLDHFHPPFIAAFKSYARQLLEHVNPLTGRAYKDEPGVALIEMNNENSLVLNPWWMSKLEEPFVGELRELFVKHLRTKYADTDKLREAWGLNDGSTGPDLIQNGRFTEETKHWQSETNFGSKATLTPIDGGVRWTSTQSGKENYSLQFSQPGLNLEDSKAYRLSFRARSEKKAALDVHAQNSAPPWAQLGMQEKMDLTPQWQSFEFEFAPHSVLPDGKNRIVFSLLNAVTSVDITDVKLVSISTGYLKPDQTLEAGNIPVPGRNAGPAVRRDFIEFLAQLEIDHALEMKKFIREEIGAKQMITHSQLLFGGIVGARREFIVSDLVDTHGYWHHPHFPHKAWDMSDWEINNVSQITAEDGGTLAEMAMQRPVGKPYSVSEYDTPAPNDFAAETFPMLAAMACLQDWSAVYHFNFKHSAKFDSDKITSFFDLPGHPAKQAFMPLAALVFRQGLIKPSNVNVVLPLSSERVVGLAADKAGDVWGSWRDLWGKYGLNGAAAWRMGARYDFSGQKNEEKPFVESQSDDQGRPLSLVHNRFNAGPLAEQVLSTDSMVNIKAKEMKADGNAFVIIGSQPAAEFGDDASKFGFTVTELGSQSVLMLAPLDGEPVASSKKLWLCALSRAENQGMVWDKDRRTVGNKWGHGPALVLGVKAKIELPGNATWKIEALDPTGAPQAVIADQTRQFDIDPSQKTVWWLLTRP